MAAFDETPDLHSFPVPGRPVFVDASGRRLRRLKFLGIGALAVVAGYLSLLLVAVVGGPNIAAPYLPFPVSPAVPEARVAPSAGDTPTSRPVPASEGSGDAAAAGPLTQTVSPAPAGPVPAVPVAPPVGGAVAGPVAPVATIAPGSGPSTGQGVSPTPPTTVQSSAGRSGAAPGRAVRPSAPAHP